MHGDDVLYGYFKELHNDMARQEPNISNNNGPGMMTNEICKQCAVGTADFEATSRDGFPSMNGNHDLEHNDSSNGNDAKTKPATHYGGYPSSHSGETN